MERLSEHSGPKTRYSTGKHYKRLVLERDNEESEYGIHPRKILENENEPTYENSDLPINQYNRQLRNEMDTQEENVNYEAENSNSEMDISSEDYSSSSDEESELSSDEENYIVPSRKKRHINNNHIRHNRYPHRKKIKHSLESYLDRKRSSSKSQKNSKIRENMFDIMVYIISGIFLIFSSDMIFDVATKFTFFE